jgi:hypothetical protein
MSNACGGTPASPTGPGTSGPAPAPVPTARTVAVRLEGRIIDADSRSPVAGARVSANEVQSTGSYGPLAQPLSTVSDASGAFVLNATLPEDWADLLLGVERAGYESTSIYVQPSSTTGATLEVYRTLTIRPGEAIDVQLSLGHYVCGWESHACRPLVVDSPAGELVDIQVASAIGDDSFGLAASEEPSIVEGVYTSGVTVPAAKIWIFGSGRAVVTARRH